MVLGVGIDIQSIQRMEQVMARGKQRLILRTFTPTEVKYCRRQKKPCQHFCGRFCAKEAFFKALGTGWAKGLAWTEVEIVRQNSGQPKIKLTGRAADLAARARVKKIWLSLSHSREYAAATVILEG
jgi:holo-[acyl-carrier protein] synthase